MPWWFWCLVIPGGLFLYLSIGCGLYILTSELVDEDWRYDFKYESGFIVVFLFLWPILEPIYFMLYLKDVASNILRHIASIGDEGHCKDGGAGQMSENLKMGGYIPRWDAVFTGYCKQHCTPGPLCPDGLCIEARQMFSHIPDADVVEVRYGRWIDCSYSRLGQRVRIVKCDKCGNYLDLDGVNAGRGDAKYCPNCGAKMDGGKEG